MEGLERLFVIAVGLDEKLDLGGDQASKLLRVALSAMHRAVTRSQLYLAVVDRQMKGGLLEFLLHMPTEGSDADSFEFDKAKGSLQGSGKRNKSSATRKSLTESQSAHPTSSNQRGTSDDSTVPNESSSPSIPHDESNKEAVESTHPTADEGAALLSSGRAVVQFDGMGVFDTRDNDELEDRGPFSGSFTPLNAKVVIPYMPKGRDGHASVVLKDGRVLVIGGNG